MIWKNANESNVQNLKLLFVNQWNELQSIFAFYRKEH